MPEKDKDARKILGEMNTILAPQALLAAQMAAGLVGGPLDPDTIKRLKADL